MDKVNLTKTEVLLFIFLTMMISGASAIASNDFARVGFLGGLVVYARKNYIPVLNGPLAFILGGWLLINVLASLFLETSIQYYPFAGKITLIYISYLVLNCIKYDFWRKYEYFLHIIVVISFGFYIFLQILPSFFAQIAPFFRPLTADTFYLKSSQQNFFYAFVFVYNNGIDLIRNNGFMWEPGAYAMLLIILIAYNIATHGARINKRIITYLIALVTTFSTAGYLALSVILMLLLLREKNYSSKILILIGGTIALFWIMDAEFLLPKIEGFINAAQKNEVNHQVYRKMYEANRLLSAQFLYDKFAQYPWGWGTVVDNSSFLSENKIATVSGLGSILVTWGGVFTSWFLYSLGLLYYRYSSSILVTVFLLFSISITFLSNPIEDNILFYILILSPYIHSLD